MLTVSQGNLSQYPQIVELWESSVRATHHFLTEEAIQELKIDTLDVNEQNPQAVGFYQYMGFVIIGRSEFDGQGEPYPLLHMKLLANDLDKGISL